MPPESTEDRTIAITIGSIIGMAFLGLGKCFSILSAHIKTLTRLFYPHWQFCTMGGATTGIESTSRECTRWTATTVTATPL